MKVYLNEPDDDLEPLTDVNEIEEIYKDMYDTEDPDFDSEQIWDDANNFDD